MFRYIIAIVLLMHGVGHIMPFMVTPLERLPCGFKREEASPWLDQSFDEPMVLFDEGVERVHLTSCAAYRKPLHPCEDVHRVGEAAFL